MKEKSALFRRSHKRMSVARSTHPSARTALKLDRAAQIIEKKLESEPLILELLLGSAVKGQSQRQMWDALHVAAVRDGRVAELGAAYDHLLQSTKMKLILAPILAEVLTRAAAREIGRASCRERVCSVV